jgi:hypothetical protein
MELGKLPPGKLTLLLGIPDSLKSGKPLGLANTDFHRDPAKRLTLGTLLPP